jgi:Phage integrase family.
MATIRPYKKKNGSVSYRAEIVIKKDGETVHRESKSFRQKQLAKAWATKREAELQQSQVYGKRDPVPIYTLFEEYIERFDAGRSKRYDLLRLQDSKIAKLDAYKLTSKDIIAHCAERLKETKPQTVKNDIIWLKSVMSTMKGVHDHKYSLDMFTPAYAVLRKEGMIAKPEQRDRLPTNDELWLLSRHFRTKKHYLHIMWFAIFSARRLSEITKLQWKDINHKNRSIMVRDMKTPNKAELNLRAKLPRSAYKIIMRQPKKGDLIFPFNPKSISTAFTRACKVLGIDDLHFHDLRHEAVTRLFLAGLNVPQVQKVSLHQTWASLSIYTNLISDDIDI